MTCAFVQTAAPGPACQTVSLEPVTASASNDPPELPVLPEAPAPLLPGASVTVPAGTAGSPRHPFPGPPIASARPPASRTHAPPPAPHPTAATPATPLSTAH